MTNLLTRLRARYWATHHRDTDPACVYYRTPRHGSRRDRHSRGRGCLVCMRARYAMRRAHVLAMIQDRGGVKLPPRPITFLEVDRAITSDQAARLRAMWSYGVLAQGRTPGIIQVVAP